MKSTLRIIIVTLPYKVLQACSFVLVVLLLFTQCRKKEFEEYYGRPDNLEAPIF